MTNEHHPSVTHETALTRKESVELSSQRLITVRQFLEEGLAEKVASGECEVFEVVAPPGENASQAEKVAFEYMLLSHGNGISVQTVEKVDEDYFIVEGVGMKGNHQLVMFNKAKK